MKKFTPNPKLVAFWKRLTPDLRKQFTKMMRSSPGSIRQYAEGRRGISAAVAVRLEKATRVLGVTTPLDRTELNKTCAQCAYAKVAKRCLKKGAV